MTTPLPPIEHHRAYSVTQAGAYLGIRSPGVIRAMADAGEFGPGGAWPVMTSTGSRVHAVRIAGWAIDKWIADHAIRAS